VVTPENVERVPECLLGKAHDGQRDAALKRSEFRFRSLQTILIVQKLLARDYLRREQLNERMLEILQDQYALIMTSRRFTHIFLHIQ